MSVIDTLKPIDTDEDKPSVRMGRIVPMRTVRSLWLDPVSCDIKRLPGTEPATPFDIDWSALAQPNWTVRTVTWTRWKASKKTIQGEHLFAPSVEPPITRNSGEKLTWFTYRYDSGHFTVEHTAEARPDLWDWLCIRPADLLLYRTVSIDGIVWVADLEPPTT